MDPENIKEGDKVVVDVQKIIQKGGDVGEEFRDWKESPIYVTGFDDSKVMGEISPQKVMESDVPEKHKGKKLSCRVDYNTITKKLCKECDTEMVYHDKSEEYICLFCNEEMVTQ